MNDVFALLTATAVAFGPLAVADTKLVDMVRNLLPSGPRWLWNVLAFGIGIAVCVLFQLNVVDALVHQVPALADTDLSGVSGQLLTGLGVGGFASYWHERMDLASARAKGTASS